MKSSSRLQPKKLNKDHWGSKGKRGKISGKKRTKKTTILPRNLDGGHTGGKGWSSSNQKKKTKGRKRRETKPLGRAWLKEEEQDAKSPLSGF